MNRRITRILRFFRIIPTPPPPTPEEIVRACLKIRSRWEKSVTSKINGEIMTEFETFEIFCRRKLGYWFGDPFPDKPYLFTDLANALSSYLEEKIKQ